MLRLLQLIAILCSVAALKHPDEVETLPGVDFPLHYRHYSGYLNASDGKFLHYWFVESQRSPSTDPVVLWLNGGPGCSSLSGFLTELGPLHVDSDGETLHNNIFSWNNEANVIFLETPSGTGFSYSLRQNYSADDDSVSSDSYLALQHFFQKFPEFGKNDFYITGESYAGIYIPTLSVRVLNGPAQVNFKGFAIGNGLLDTTNLTNALVFFAYYHGLVGPQLWNDLKTYCCKNGIGAPEYCNFVDPEKSRCADAVFYVNHIVQGGYGLNRYNLYADCEKTPDKNSRDSVNRRTILRLFPQSQKLRNLKDYIPCIDSSSVRSYLNQPAVREALHIPSTVQAWEVCSSDVEINYKQLYQTMKPQILQLVKSGKVRGLIYNGDVDMAANFLGDLWFSDGLSLKVLDNYKEWNYNGQVAGFVKYYDNLTYLTVKGSGHMAPQDKPAQAFHMISRFLSNQRL